MDGLIGKGIWEREAQETEARRGTMLTRAGTDTVTVHEKSLRSRSFKFCIRPSAHRVSGTPAMEHEKTV